MRDKVFFPSPRLTPYIKYYWTCKHDWDTLEVMYPSGCLEFCIDISDGETVRHRGDCSMPVPRQEVLGHWTLPTKATLKKGNSCLITRFHPFYYDQAHFIKEFRSYTGMAPSALIKPASDRPL